MFDLLNNKPQIGVISGLGSWIMYILQEVFTNDAFLKIVAGFGIWLGLIVAVLSVWSKLIEIKKLKRK
jgi:hypothetical protein